MPEGDTIRNMVLRFRPRMAGQRIVRAFSRWPSASFGLAGRTIVDLEPIGKNLFVPLDDGTAIRVHLGMRGRWRWVPVGESHGGSPGNVSLLLAFEGGTAVCTGAPTVERMPAKAKALHPVLGALGPDVLADAFDVDAVIARIPRSPAPTVAEVLLDQQVACGIGNVYKSEVLFERRVHPFEPPVRLAEHVWRDLYRIARDQMQRNVGGGYRRVTTAPSTREAYAVYGRAGRPCLGCGAPIVAKISGEGIPRWTWWCPMCQRPGPPAGEERA
jgi:endonuclease VIII